MTSVAIEPAQSDRLSSDGGPRPLEAIAALVLAAVALTAGLARDVPLTCGECRLGRTIREMAQAHDWAVPRLAGEPSPATPPVPCWSAGAAARITGKSDALALRLPAALAALAGAGIVGALGATLFGRRVGFVAALAFAASAGVLVYGRFGSGDTQLTLLCAVAVLAFERGLRAVTLARRRVWLAGFYVALGASVLAGGGRPLLVLGPGLLAYLFVTRRLRDVPRLFVLPGALIVVAIVGGWIAAVSRDIGFETVRLLWTRDSYAALPRDESTGGAAAFLRPLGVLLAMMLPWTIALPVALIAPWRRADAAKRPALWLVWCLVTTPAVIAVALRRHDPAFMLLVLPFAAVLLAYVLDRWFWAPRPAASVSPQRWIALGIAIVVAFGVAANVLAARLGLRGVTIGTIVVTLGLAGVGFLLALWLHQTGWRRTAFVALAIVTAVATLLGRTAAGRELVPKPDYFAFAGGLRSVAAVAPGELKWLAPPDPCLLYYTGQSFGRVLTDAAIAKAMRQAPGGLRHADADRLVRDAAIAVLRKPEPCFIVAEAWQVREPDGAVPFAEVAQVIYTHPSFDGNARRNLVVLANAAGAETVRRSGRRDIVMPEAAARPGAAVPIEVPTTAPPSTRHGAREEGEGS